MTRGLQVRLRPARAQPSDDAELVEMPVDRFILLAAAADATAACFPKADVSVPTCLGPGKAAHSFDRGRAK